MSISEKTFLSRLLLIRGEVEPSGGSLFALCPFVIPFALCSSLLSIAYCTSPFVLHPLLCTIQPV
jgi:hypothetical protein